MDKHAYWAYAFSATGTQRELLLGELERLPTLGFVETDDELITYLEADKLEEDLVARLALLAGVHQVPYRREFVPGENWNAQWEASFQPIQIGGFVGIRAEFTLPLRKWNTNYLSIPVWLLVRDITPPLIWSWNG